MAIKTHGEVLPADDYATCVKYGPFLHQRTAASGLLQRADSGSERAAAGAQMQQAKPIFLLIR